MLMSERTKEMIPPGRSDWVKDEEEGERDDDDGDDDDDVDDVVVDDNSKCPDMNQGARCWNECKRETGECDWCDGLCCRQGSEWAINGCDGKLGAKNSHICVQIPGR